MEAHGGYLCRLETFETAELVALARQALVEDGCDPTDASLLLSAMPQERVLRMAYDAPHTYGRKGARWYDQRHTLARLASVHLRLTVHTYVFDPEEFEQVVTYGSGRRVGGDRVVYEDAELPEDDDGELDEECFDKLKAGWPLGHLAKLFGVPREALLRIPRGPTVLLELDGRPIRGRVLDLFPAPRRSGAHPALPRVRFTLDEPSS